MRDPGEPRRNPFFDGDSVPPTGGPSMPALIAAMQEAGPEASEHLLNAAHEFLLAVKVVVDAAERALAETRDVSAEPAAPASEPERRPRSSAASTPRVRRIDVG